MVVFIRLRTPGCAGGTDCAGVGARDGACLGIGCCVPAWIGARVGVGCTFRGRLVRRRCLCLGCRWRRGRRWRRWRRGCCCRRCRRRARARRGLVLHSRVAGRLGLGDVARLAWESPGRAAAGSVWGLGRRSRPQSAGSRRAAGRRGAGTADRRPGPCRAARNARTRFLDRPAPRPAGTATCSWRLRSAARVCRSCSRKASCADAVLSSNSPTSPALKRPSTMPRNQARDARSALPGGHRRRSCPRGAARPGTHLTRTQARDGRDRFPGRVPTPGPLNW